MKVVVYPHVLDIGGSQLNAIELASAVRDLGHEVIVFAQPGPLAARIHELDLEYVVAPPPRGRPAPRVMNALCSLVRRRGVDLVHGYEWTAALEAYFGPRATLGVPACATVNSMSVAPFIPRDMPLAVSTEQIAAHERDLGRSDVAVIEPPVDTDHNAPGVAPTDEFFATYELDRDALTIVVVTRLAPELKLEGILTAIDVVAELAAEHDVQLVVVGGGPSAAEVRTRADRANARAGRRVVVLTGEVSDPRPAYAAADLSLGMGSSALRAMAFASPIVVQGECGFWERLTPDTEAQFLWTGWYGVGDGAPHGHAKLASLLRPLLADPARRAELGRYAHGLVNRRFSLRRMGARQLELYERAIETAPTQARQWLAPAAGSASKLAVYRVGRRVDQLRGRISVDDFNAKPVAAGKSLAPSSR